MTTARGRPRPGRPCRGRAHCPGGPGEFAPGGAECGYRVVDRSGCGRDCVMATAARWVVLTETDRFRPEGLIPARRPARRMTGLELVQLSVSIRRFAPDGHRVPRDRGGPYAPSGARFSLNRRAAARAGRGGG